MLGEELIEQEEVKRKQEKLFEQQKKFRNVESDKKMFAEETINLIKKQKMTIDKMRKENQALKELIAKVNDRGETRTQPTQVHKQYLTEISNAIQEEKEAQKSIQVHINNFQKKIIEKKKNCLGMNSGAESESSLQKQIKILENRLDKANQKFNETIATNKELKLVIDSLRKERVIFDNLYKKLEGELQEKRKKMADIIEKANNAYEDRDKANNQINALKQQAKKEAGEFEKEIRQVSHLLEKIKLSTYAKRSQKTPTIEDQARYHSHYEQLAPPEHKITKQTKKSSEQMEKIQKYREDFAKIEAATEIDNFEELLRIFGKNQEKNFQMFKFVNLQSNEIQQLEYEMADLRKQLQKDSLPVHNQKEQFISEMEQSLHVLSQQLQQTDQDYKQTQKEAKAIMGLVERLFQTIECDREVVKEIGGAKTISETNLLIFLAVIEEKASKIVDRFNKLSNANMLGGNAARTSHNQPAILTFEDFEDNEEYDKILSFEQLRQKAQDFIDREQTQKQKKKDLRPKKK